MDFAIENLQMISHPVSIDTKHHLLSRTNSGDVTDERDNQMICINAACAVDKDSEYAEKNREGLSNAMTKLSKLHADLLLQFEQQRTNFLTAEVGRLRAMRRDHSSFTEMMVESKLAQQLVETYHSFKDQLDCCLLLNDWMYTGMSLTMPSPSEIKPFQGLLLYETPKRQVLCRILETLPPNASPILVILIKALKCTCKSIEDIAAERNYEYETVERAALHLLSWGKAKAMIPMKNISLYRIVDDFVQPEGLAIAFERSFPKIGAFSSLLSNFLRPNCIKNLLYDTLRKRDFVP